MNPDRAAEMLQIPERGLDLLRRCEDEPAIFKAIQAIQSGFAPRDVAAMYDLTYEEGQDTEQGSSGDYAMLVWECNTARCRQKGRVSTGSEQPNCPSCRQPMVFVMGADDESEFAHMRRTYVPDPGLADPLSRTDRTKAGSPWEDAE